MLSFIRRWFTGSPKNAKQPIHLPTYGVIECKECHKFLRNRYVLKLIVHLEQHHKLTDAQAHDVATHMSDLLLNATKETRNGRT